MNVGSALAEFFEDGKVKILLVLIVLDLLFGSLSALKRGTFRLSYFADFLKNDVLWKLVPYFALYFGALVAGDADIGVEGFDLGLMAGAAYVACVVAWAGSILNSLAELKDAPSGDLTVRSVIAGAEGSDAPPSAPVVVDHK